MGINQLYTLLKKYRESQCTPDELDELARWYTQFDEDAEKIPEIPQEKLDHLYLEVKHKICSRPKYRIPVQILKYVAGIAAIVVLGWVGGFYLTTDESGIGNGNIAYEQYIMPGTSQAELVLGDGSRIALDEHTVVKDKNGLLIKKDKMPLLDYSLAKGETHLKEFNTISVPLGGEFGVVLSDGTRVWLNSGSTLNYPVSFEDSVRKVYLTGEAYFKVNKSHVPFVVKASDVDVRVMGTSFNISAYCEDDRIMTTLVDGKVIVYPQYDTANYEMKPGYMLSYEKKTSKITMEECDTELYTSWINGEFKFRDMRLEDIMVKLNRWYNCEFFYQNSDLKDLRFTGAVEKDRPVNYLLEMIETVTEVHFEIKGKTVVLQSK